MTIQDYFEALVGQYLEVAGTDARNQCVDNANFYIKFVLRLPIIEYTNARDFPSKAGDAYEWIPNSDTNFPIEGDIVIWGGNVWGHIGVCIEGDSKRFKSMDENWPIGSPCMPVEHTYKYPLPVLGWLRPKVKPTTDLQAQLDQLRQDRDRNWNMFTAVCTALGVGANVDAAVAEAKKLVGNDDVLVQKDKQIADAQTQITDLKSQLQSITESHNTLLVSYNDLQSTLSKDTNTIAELDNKLSDLEKQIHAPVVKGWKKALIDIINKF